MEDKADKYIESLMDEISELSKLVEQLRLELQAADSVNEAKDKEIKQLENTIAYYINEQSK